MIFWSDENGPKIWDFWKKFQSRPVWPVVWARKPKIVTHHYQLTLGNPPVKGLEVSWFLGLRIILLIQNISVKLLHVHSALKMEIWVQNEHFLMIAVLLTFLRYAKKQLVVGSKIQFYFSGREIIENVDFSLLGWQYDFPNCTFLSNLHFFCTFLCLDS